MTDAPTQPTAQPLERLLDASRAEAAFKDAVRALAEGRPQDRIAANAGSPPIKVLRVVMKLLETAPELPIERVRIEGRSGCSDYVGRLRVEPGGREAAFAWDCRWRAQQLGWMDPWGDPDQARAAREWGYQCFRIFEWSAAAAAHDARGT